MAATIAQTSATVDQGGTSNIQGFQAHHPPTYMGGGDSMVRTTLAIEREVEDTRSIQDMGASVKRKENQFSSSSRRSRRLLLRTNLKDRAVAIKAKARPGLLARQDR